MEREIKRLLTCVDLEEKEQAIRYKLDQAHTLKQLKAEGIALHPVRVLKKYFGYADYPELQFRLSVLPETRLFRDGSSIELFKQGEEVIRGVFLGMDGLQGELRLTAPDFPDWIDDEGVGIKLSPDTHTSSVMKEVIKSIPTNKQLSQLFQHLYNADAKHHDLDTIPANQLEFKNPRLNLSQKQAVRGVLHNKQIIVLHGPPGTGKTTTLIEAIVQLSKKQEKILVSAPSNTAIDHISKGLILCGINVLRVGNASKADPIMYAHTAEGRMKDAPEMKEIKSLKQRADEFRKMALKYKRHFGKAEREQRNLLFQEVKKIRKEIKNIQQYHEEKMFAEAQVIAGTPIGIYDTELRKITFDTLIIDEAGQCLEPLAWTVMGFAPKVVLAGDHFQLPPTVLSKEAANLGLERSILELAVSSGASNFLLDTQYRMRASIAGFSSHYFYQGRLQTPSSLSDKSVHLVFVDTAGSGYNEEEGVGHSSLQNKGELQLILKILEEEKHQHEIAVISPYSGQVTLAKQTIRGNIRISTIDSFQGQEMDCVVISLVRSNELGEIGFLKDYRRMNVAITRAREKLIVIGDSATIAQDVFYASFIDYVEQHGEYRTSWDYADT